MVEADDVEAIRLAGLVDRLWRGPTRNLDPPTTRMEWTRRVLRAGRYLDAREPGRLAAVRDELERYAREIDADGEAPASYATRTVIRWAIADAGALLIGLPLAFIGLIVHVVPYRLTGRLVRALRTDPDMEATAKIAFGTLLFPLAWAAEAVLIGALGGAAAVFAFVTIVLPSGLVALTWQERLARARGDLKGFARFVLRPNRHKRLVERRSALIEELRTLADTVPAEVLSGERA
jgi:hypothetical protein